MLKKLTNRRTPQTALNNHRVEREAEIKRGEFNKRSGEQSTQDKQLNSPSLKPALASTGGNQDQLHVASGKIRKQDNQLTTSFKYFPFKTSKFINLTRSTRGKKESLCNKAENVEKNGPDAVQDTIASNSMTEQKNIEKTKMSTPEENRKPKVETKIAAGKEKNKEPLKPSSNKKKHVVKSSKHSRGSTNADQNKFTVKFLKSNVSDRTWLITPDERKTYKTLDLRKAKLSHIPASVLQLRGFQAVRLSCNEELSSIRELGHMGSLKIVDLKNCGITSFSETGIGLNKLKALELSNNDKIKDFSDLRTLPHLQHLSLAGCLLRVIPADALMLKKLQVLVLDNNPLDDRILDFSLLTDLQVLLLANCGLTQLPKSIHSLRELMYFSVANNGIKRLSDEVTDLPSLKVINAFGNNGFTIYHSIRHGSLLKKIQVDEEFNAEKVPRKTKRLIEVWKKEPTAWWKHV